SQSPVAGIACAEETKCMESIDKAILGMVSKSSGCNESERKMETLHEAYQLTKNNDGAPGIDGVTFEAIEEGGVESFLKQIQDELVNNTYQPKSVRKKEIPKDGGTKVRVLSIPSIRDRVVQGALKLILEPIFEADFQAGSYGYRPKRSAHEAIDRVDQADCPRVNTNHRSAYFDNFSIHGCSRKWRDRFRTHR